MKVALLYPDWEDIDEPFKTYERQKGFGVVRCSGSFKCNCSQTNDVSDKEKEKLKQKHNSLWTYECYGMPERKRKVNGAMFPLIRSFMK